MQGKEDDVQREGGFHGGQGRSDQAGYDRNLPEVRHQDVPHHGEEVIGVSHGYTSVSEFADDTGVFLFIRPCHGKPYGMAGHLAGPLVPSHVF